MGGTRLFPYLIRFISLMISLAIAFMSKRNIKNVITGKVKTTKLSEYFEYRKCEYCYLQLIPIKSNR